MATATTAQAPVSARGAGSGFGHSSTGGADGGAGLARQQRTLQVLLASTQSSAVRGQERLQVGGTRGFTSLSCPAFKPSATPWKACNPYR